MHFEILYGDKSFVFWFSSWDLAVKAAFEYIFSNNLNYLELYCPDLNRTAKLIVKER